MMEREKLTKLAKERTKLAYERTIMAYVRTATTVVLFGMAFLGFSKTIGDFLYWSGIASIAVGVLFLLLAIYTSTTHYKKIKAT